MNKVEKKEGELYQRKNPEIMFTATVRKASFVVLTPAIVQHPKPLKKNCKTILGKLLKRLREWTNGKTRPAREVFFTFAMLSLEVETFSVPNERHAVLYA